MFLKKIFKIFRKDVTVNPGHRIAISSVLWETKGKTRENGQLWSSMAKTKHKQFTVLWCGSRGLFCVCFMLCLFLVGWGVNLTNIFFTDKINYLNYQVKYQAKYQIIQCFGTIRWEHWSDDLYIILYDLIISNII